MNHKVILEDIVRRLQRVHNGIVIYNEEYLLNSGQFGEIDIYKVYDNKEAIAVEVKKKNNPINIHKATMQLVKDMEYLKEKYDINDIRCYYAFSVRKRRGYDVIEVK